MIGFHSALRLIGSPLSIVIPIYLSILGFDPLSIGLFFTVTRFSSALRAIFFGILSDKYGRKRLLILDKALSTVYYLALIFSRDLLILAVASLIGGGVGSIGYGVILNALLADKSPRERRTRVFSLKLFAGSLFSVFGTLLSSLPVFLQVYLGLGELDSFQPVFTLGLCITWLSIMMITSITESKPASPLARTLLPRKSLKNVGKFSVTGAWDSLGAGITLPLFSLWLHLRFNIGLEVVGLIFTLSRALETFAHLAAPTLASTVGTVKGIVLIRGVAAALLALVAFTPTPLLAALTYAARSTFQHMSHPLRQSYMMGILDPDERVSAAALNTLPRLGISPVAPTIGGYLLSFSYVLPPITSAACFSMGIIFYWHFFRNVKPPEEILEAPVFQETFQPS